METHQMIIRRAYREDATLGQAELKMPAQNYTFCTLELPWKNNERRISCIPEGKYKAKPHISPKFGRCFWIQDVPGRSEILIHPGNFTSQILGCILPGTAHKDINGDKIPDVVSSKVVMEKLLTYITKDFELVICSQSGTPYK
jgi:hypothetical protein